MYKRQTNIPPHNLREVVDAVVKIIDTIIEEQRETTMEEILDIVKGPDFPTGATILGRRGIEEAYRTGCLLYTSKLYTDIRFLLLWMKHMVHIFIILNIFRCLLLIWELTL